MLEWWSDGVPRRRRGDAQGLLMRVGIIIFISAESVTEAVGQRLSKWRTELQELIHRLFTDELAWERQETARGRMLAVRPTVFRAEDSPAARPWPLKTFRVPS